MRGPGLRVNPDVRRLWRCPACGRELKVAKTETAMRCTCTDPPMQMKLIEGKRAVRPEPRLVARFIEESELPWDENEPREPQPSPAVEVAAESSPPSGESTETAAPPIAESRPPRLDKEQKFREQRRAQLAARSEQRRSQGQPGQRGPGEHNKPGQPRQQNQPQRPPRPGHSQGGKPQGGNPQPAQSRPPQPDPSAPPEEPGAEQPHAEKGPRRNRRRRGRDRQPGQQDAAYPAKAQDTPPTPTAPESDFGAGLND